MRLKGKIQFVTRDGRGVIEKTISVGADRNEAGEWVIDPVCVAYQVRKRAEELFREWSGE